jgi:hypothetical protein
MENPNDTVINAAVMRYANMGKRKIDVSNAHLSNANVGRPYQMAV